MSLQVYLIGVGMGNPETLTAQAERTIKNCPVLVGAPRLIEPYREKTCVSLVRAEEIAAYIRACSVGPVAVLLSGDTGFYSGAKSLWPLLSSFEVHTIPGVSSLSYLCAQIQTCWQDVHVVSAHGRAHNAVGEIQSHAKTFVLTGGQSKAGDILAELLERGLGHLPATVGERLSYPDERILQCTVEELSRRQLADLAVLLVENPQPVPWGPASMPDSAFIRADVPMTKEEVRTVALSKLHLLPHHILWDVGAGTGSVSVTGALQVPAGRVYAVERDQEALSLILQNREKHCAWNLVPVAGSAPEALEPLPAPDRVFIGGTSGGLEQVLRVALVRNPAVRIAVTAVTLETLNEAVRCFSLLGLLDVDITQLAVTKTRAVGQYHMLNAQNPVWIISGEGRP